MDNKLKLKVDFICKICNKEYSSYKSLWNHNTKFHNVKIPQCQYNVNTKSIPCKYNVNNAIISCEYCKKIFTTRQAKSLHIKKYCKNIIDKDIKLEEIKLQLAKEESKILQLKLKLQNSTKVDNITLKKLNKLLLERNNLIKNSTINSHNKIQNNITNNFQLVGFGKEEVVELLTNKDKKLIMNSKYCSLEKLIEIVHCGTYNQFKNIVITNMKDNFMYKYDDSKGQFILSTKNDVLNSLINYRLEDLEVIYNDLLGKNKLDDVTKNCIETFINKINYVDSKFTDIDGKQHDNYKQYKINEIKVLLFNNQDKITNDISLLLIANEIEPELIKYS